MKKTSFKLIILFFLLLATLFDLFTYLLSCHFLKGFETNLLVSFVPTIGMVFVKLLGVGFLALVYFKLSDKAKPISQMALSTVMLILIIVQCFGGYSNLKVKQDILTETGYSSLDDIPQEEIDALEPTADTKRLALLSMSIFFLYLPLIIALLGFKIWQLSF